MRLRKNTNGSVPKLANGGAQQVEAATDCCCGTAGCDVSIFVPCTEGDAARLTECTGRITSHVVIDAIDAESYGPATDFTSWTMDGSGEHGLPTAYYAYFGAYMFNTTFTGGITGIPTPAPNANMRTNGGVNAGEIQQPYYGYYISQTVNGDTSTFDVLPTGYTHTASHSDFSRPNDPAYSGYTSHSVSNLATFADTIYKEASLQFNLEKLDASNIDAGAQWTVGYARRRMTLNSETYSGPSPAVTTYPVITQQTRTTVSCGNDGSITIANESPCTPEPADVAMDLKTHEMAIAGTEISFGYQSISNISGGGNAFFNTTASSQESTIRFATDGDGIDLDLAGCRDCPRVLDVSGSFDTPCHPTEGVPFYDPNEEPWAVYDEDLEEWIPGPDAVLENVTFTIRLVQTAVAVCETYTCTWQPSDVGTITTSGGDFEFTGGSLSRISPNFYTFAGPDGTWHLKLASGDCPTGEWTVRQDPNPHTLTGTGASQTYDLDAPYVDTFTNRVISTSAGDCEETDPTYFCDGGCSGAAFDYVVDIDCGGGYPTGWSTYIEVNQGTVCQCKWTGNNGDYSAVMEYDESSGEWSLTITRNSDSVVVFTAIPWAATGDDPTGSHGYDSSIWDEDPCNTGGIFAVVS